MPSDSSGFDRSAAVTRSLLGWGVVAGPFYLLVSVIISFFVPDFRLWHHELFELMHREHGWAQRVNTSLAGLMVIAAALGILRTPGFVPSRLIGILVGIFGISLLLSAIPVTGSGALPATFAIVTSILVIIGFLGYAVAACVFGRWATSRAEVGLGRTVSICGAIMLVSFFGFFILVFLPFGVPLLRLFVVAEWLWLLVASLRLYRLVPHPVIAQRGTAGGLA